MKTRTLLIAAVMFIGLSAVAFSQAAVYTVSSTPITMNAAMMRKATHE